MARTSNYKGIALTKGLLAATLWIVSSCSGPAADPCAAVTCSGHGACVQAGGSASCACDSGYYAQGLSCLAEPVCGNDVIDPLEDCDGTALGGATCASRGWAAGTLACAAADCTFDESGCFTCGNATIEGPEACESGNLAGETCVTRGFAGGALACSADCLSFDETGCTCPDPPGFNACGGCAVLTAAPGDPCGNCGTYACDGVNAVACADPGLNACGGCAVLTGTPGDSCGSCGSYVCAGPDAVSCTDPGLNACGGCAVLTGAPGDLCGSCGTYACSGTDAVACADPGFNACGGCAALTALPGDPCGTCGTYACSGSDAVACADPGLNACGGCAALAGLPGDPCGSCGTYACSGADAVACTDPGFNACGGCTALTALPGDPCGGCGAYACAGTDAVACNNSPLCSSCINTFDSAPAITQMLASYSTLSYNAAAARLDWVTSGGIAPEPFATAIDVPNPSSDTLVFDIAVTAMGPSGNTNVTNVSWIDPTATWLDLPFTFSSPSRGLGIDIENSWTGTPTSGSIIARVEQAEPTTGTIRYATDSLIGPTFQVRLTYDPVTGAYSVRVVELGAGIVRVDTSGTMTAGLSLTRLAVVGGYAEATAPRVEDRGWIDVLESSCDCVDTFDSAPAITQMLASYSTLSYNAAAARLDWVTSGGFAPEPFATAIDVPNPGFDTLVFDVAVTAMGPSGNTNVTNVSWIDPTTTWLDLPFTFSSPSRGLGIDIENSWTGTPTSGSIIARVEQAEPTTGTTRYATGSLIGPTFQVRLTYDPVTGAYSVRVVELGAGIVRVDTSGTMTAGLSLTRLAVVGGYAEAFAPAVLDRGWIDLVELVGGICR